MPREFDRLFKRTREGELENEDQISSEVRAHSPRVDSC